METYASVLPELNPVPPDTSAVGRGNDEGLQPLSIIARWSL